MVTLKLGSSGPEVGRLHQLLVEAGEAIDQGELRQAFYGPSTRVAVLDFQASHVDPQGRPLASDAVVGPITWASLERPRAPLESYQAPGWIPELGRAADPERAACEAAIREIGAMEVPPGSNRGPRVDVYAGPDWLGQPWCALFVSWCWSHAPSGSPFGTRASALKIRDWAASAGALVGIAQAARPGDLAVILRAGGRGHVELVVAPQGFGRPLSLVGGNVGNAVRGTVRSRESLTALVRPRPQT